MKRKTFIIEEYEIEIQETVQKLIAAIVKEGDIDLMIRLKYYHTPLTRRLIDSIADTIKAVGKEHEFVVDIVLETDQWKKIKQLRRKLNQYSISLDLKVSDGLQVKEIAHYKKKLLLDKIMLSCKDYDTFYQSYHRWKTAGLSIALEEYELTLKEYLQFFEEWIHDPKATWFVPFEDIISCMMTGVPAGICEHSSCMGKYLYLDQNKKVYFCAKKRENTQMYSLTENVPDLLYNEIYDNALGMAIEKRNQCAEECELFGLCRGGCPLDEKLAEACGEYIQKVSRIGEFIEKEIVNSFTDIENPCMRQFYLSLIAYGFRFSQ
ncbi:MAG: hypothetical protein IJZ34_17265 [Lachnospiraceae bacterium]|nr:hypothetical protein [Lachnospiraceae bacterium]